MDTLKAINTRRSIRKYKNKKIPTVIVKQLIEAGRNAPSAFNSQPWVFILITKLETKKIIVKAKGGGDFIATAPLVIACCYDQTKSKSKYHDIENVAVATENILLTAHALGLGACYLGGFDPENPLVEEMISKALKLPSHIKLVCLISIGYPDEKPIKKKKRPLSEITRKETYK